MNKVQGTANLCSKDPSPWKRAGAEHRNLRTNEDIPVRSTCLIGLENLSSNKSSKYY